MYKLTYSPASPYVRKVMLAAYSIKINHEIDLVSSENKFFQDFKSKNPTERYRFITNFNLTEFLNNFEPFFIDQKY